MAMRATSARMTADRVMMTQVGCRTLSDTTLVTCNQPQLAATTQADSSYSSGGANGSFGPHEFARKRHISITSAIFTELMGVSNTHTDRPRKVCRNSPHLTLRLSNNNNGDGGCGW